MSNKMTMLEPTNLTEAMQFAETICKSGMVPKDYQGKPANTLVAIQWGYEVGLAPMQALQNISVINGKPTIWGDSALALCKSHPDYRGGRGQYYRPDKQGRCLENIPEQDARAPS